ncbi:hypothetical protein D3C83_216190 [compost metagenome]
MVGVPVGADGVDDVADALRLEIERRRDLRQAGGTSIERLIVFEQARPSGAVDRAIDASAAQQ